jgi:hypothetical protein
VEESQVSRRRGRPPLVEGHQAQPATTWLAPDEYDEACRMASQQHVSLSQVLRIAFLRMASERAVCVFPTE